MKRLLRLAIQLYPAWWRQRYATEFEALLEDLKPGWRAVLDVLNGAITMRMRTLGTIPVLCTLAGAILGGLVAMRIPAVYASSATIRLDARASDLAGAGSPRALEFRASLEKALGEAGAAPAATTVTLDKDLVRPTIRVTYSDRDPVQAQRGAERLATAIASDGQLSRSTAVVSSASLPAAPVGPDYAMNVAVGSALGLGVGGVVVAVLAPRRRRVSARDGGPSATPL